MRLIVTREEYFTAAMAILGEQGYGALKITPLAQRIGVTTGSFYNYFGSLDGFITELLAWWEQEQTQRLVSEALAGDDAQSQLERLKTLASDSVDHAAERAIRAWSTVNPMVAAAQARVDEERKDVMRNIYGTLIDSPETVEMLAVLGLSIMAGHQAINPSDTAQRHQLFAEYQSLILLHALEPVFESGAPEPDRPNRRKIPRV